MHSFALRAAEPLEASAACKTKAFHVTCHMRSCTCRNVYKNHEFLVTCRMNRNWNLLVSGLCLWWFENNINLLISEMSDPSERADCPRPDMYMYFTLLCASMHYSSLHQWAKRFCCTFKLLFLDFGTNYNNKMRSSFRRLAVSQKQYSIIFLFTKKTALTFVRICM